MKLFAEQKELKKLVHNTIKKIKNERNIITYCLSESLSWVG